MPDTPEARHERPLKWEPADPSGEAVKQLEVVLGVAVNGNMISAQDAERMLRIIKTNPCARLPSPSTGLKKAWTVWKRSAGRSGWRRTTMKKGDACALWIAGGVVIYFVVLVVACSYLFE